MKKVIAIFGGESTEHDISIITAVEALNAIPFREYKVYPAYIHKGKWYSSEDMLDVRTFKNFNPKKHVEITLVGRDIYAFKRGKLKKLDTVDCALLLTHGGGVEGGELQGYLETLGIPYTSSDAYSSAVCLDKYALKTLLKDIGVSVIEGVKVGDIRDVTLDNIEEKIGYPAFVKPNSQGSSIGVGVGKNRAELKEKIALALVYDSDVLVEKCKENIVEYNVAAFKVGENLMLSSIEKPLNAGDFLSFENKYIDNVKSLCRCTRECPAKIPQSLKEEILLTLEKIYLALNLKGIVRCDFIYKDRLYLNEVNTIPGSLAHYLFEEQPYSETLSLLIDDAITRGNKKRASFSSSVLDIGNPKG